MYELRDYQQKAREEIKAFFLTAQSGSHELWIAPCGVGKSIIEVAVQKDMGPECYIVTPRQEIIDGMVEKGGDRNVIFTPITLRNRLLDGTIPAPRWILADEAHHDVCETADIIRLATNAVVAGLTATGYRGTPQGTQALRELYGEPHYILTLRDAVDRGLCALPTCTTVPILDDDIVEVTNGEFKVRTVEAKTPWRAATDLVQSLWQNPQPTVACLPSVSAVKILAESLSALGVPVACVTGDTGPRVRENAFDQCVSGEAVLLQVQVVSEGVDLPIRRLIDFAPTMSPVRWLQQLGRAMRPGGTSEYVCTNRNLLRHGYLLEGLVPSDAFAQADTAFPVPSKRNAIRAFGLEGIGRLKPCRVPLANGTSAWAYYISRTDGLSETQYVAIVLTNSPTPLWATRRNEGGYGKWVSCVPPKQLTGFASERPYHLTVKQAGWWKGAAARHGLDPEAKVDAKIFAALPVLNDLKLRIS